MSLLTAYIEKIFDEVLETGETVVIPCSSYKEMERLRSKLYKEKLRLSKKLGHRAEEIEIAREIKPDADEKKHAIYVSKGLGLPDAFVVEKNGKIRNLEKPLMPETEEERIARLMREDGKTEEEIETILAEKGEQDFDAAATKIEEAQAAAKGKKKKGGDK